MLEIIIVISLALSLFLVLKNFPKTGEKIKGEEMIPFWQKIFKRREKIVEEIQAEIIKGQDGLVAPIKIAQAKKKFLENDHEILKLLFEAEEALSKGDLREAEDKAILAIQKDKRCAQAYAVMGKVALLRGVFSDAKEAFRMAIKCNAEIGEACFGLGQVFLREDNYSEAILQLQRAVNLDRNIAEWQAALGRAFMGVRQFAKAAKALRRATNLDIDNKEYRELAAEAEEKQRSHSRAFRLK